MYTCIKNRSTEWTTTRNRSLCGPRSGQRKTCMSLLFSAGRNGRGIHPGPLWLERNLIHVWIVAREFAGAWQRRQFAGQSRITLNGFGEVLADVVLQAA